MRSFPRFLLLSGLFLMALSGRPLRAAELRHFDDASLRAVHFVDAAEGWAVGDDGVVCHTNDGGKNWERQPSGVSASLRSVWFTNPASGWAAGREELPAGGSAGVLLYTRDGGWTWKRLLVNALPGLSRVRFVDERVGYLVGDGSEQYPTGVFQTRDGGRHWEPVPGPRCPAWLAADFNASGGALGGVWNRLATVRNDKVHTVDMDTLGGRSIRAVQLRGDGGVAVGQGGLVLLSAGTQGSSWRYAELSLPAEVRSAWDFHAVHGTGSHIWAVGRPGSVALHSPDGGRTWQTVRTGHPFPLHAIHFQTEQHGWAVGDLGTILGTNDGGKTWTLQRRGGQRMAAFFAHSRPSGMPLDTVALLGARDGYLTAGLCVTSPDCSTAGFDRCQSSERLTAAFRAAGGTAAEGLWQFPVASHQTRSAQADLIRIWDRLHGDRAAEQLLRQLVLAIRMWKPDLVLTDGLDAVHFGGSAALVAEAVREAVKKSGDPSAFPDQLTGLGLEAHQPAKLYGGCAGAAGAQVTVDLTAVMPGVGMTLQEFAAGPGLLLTGWGSPAERSFRLLASRLEGAMGHRDLMQGIALAPGGVARRQIPAAEAPDEETIRAIRARAHFRALTSAPPGKLVESDRLLVNLVPMLSRMPDDQAAQAAHTVAWHFARSGQWNLARESFLVLVDRYPTHPLALDGLGWLIKHNASSEARRRHELGQFLITTELSVGQVAGEKPAVPVAPGPGEAKGKKNKLPEIPRTQMRQVQQLTFFSNRAETRKWYEGCLEMEARLAAFGPLHAGDPSVQFCLQAARRNLGDVETPMKWYREFAARQTDSPWRSAAQAELWLANRTGVPPRPALVCRCTDSRPYLDGKLDDPCWEGVQPVKLVNAAGDTLSRFPTEVKLAYDAEFLYVAVRCGHPEGLGEAPASVRTRDADLRGHDRISLVLDLDRDYSTWYHFQIDARGCVAEDCWGDKTWNPRWFAAIHREPTAWTAEIAIPLVALSGDRVSSGRAWAANVLRVLPGQGVQAWSLPAEAPEEAIRPEGMGLMLFAPEARKAASTR
jgi:photosystem II stability/assembly factor-like uncharacterized protein